MCAFTLLALWGANPFYTRRVEDVETISPFLRGSGCVSAIDSNGRTIWIADVRVDEKLTAFLELEAAIQRDVSA
jgi:hypothetical protein